MNTKRQNRFSHPRNTSLRSRLALVFEDEDVIVVEKPAGLLTMATDKERERTVYALLSAYVKSKEPPARLFIVHRLDREASGLLVFAKTESAKRALQDQFKDHSAGREYVAVVEGRVARDTDTIRSYLTENAVHRTYSTPSPKKGKLAVTHIRVLRRSAQRTLLEVRLETGRKHQIRAHLAERGYPILGDKVYGSRSNPLQRLALHGVSLAFKHPGSGELMVFRSSCPASFERLVHARRALRRPDR
jgi:23S rRNA pseudouridine1911/1915/1917 synthase